MFIIRALIWLAILLLLIPAAQSGHDGGVGAGAEHMQPAGRTSPLSPSSPLSVPGSTGQPRLP